MQTLTDISLSIKYEKYLNYNFNDVISYNDLIFSDIEFLMFFKDQINWKLLSAIVPLPEKILIQFKDNIDWEFASDYQQFTQKFIRNFKHKLNIEKLIYTGKIKNVKTLAECLPYLIKTKYNTHVWSVIAKCCPLNIDLINQYKTFFNKSQLLTIKNRIKENSLYKYNYN